ncbi:type II toxin-antitoxin system HipA family toxin YjjJ [Xenophilus sp. Marseille-Q4582]|uniref:type II toxin-antitoxin system HipA family toxin YjjJ n=1 Tax=Xenophilus sp. Marseille-Q4582 TaxID=2866600 RepID=UPI001CE4343A|nr:type II toxin-antitoxin system HipA family toxin YjjJ [Xenophilus sp. Marseille-Q4582]
MPAAAISSPEALRQQLARQAAASTPELAAALGVSVPTVQRLLARLPADELLTAGKARRTRYALARPLRGGPARQPVHAVDPEGRLHLVGMLTLVRPEGCWMDLSATAWPVPEEARDGWWPGLPYPLHQMRPQGYMGRQFARAEHQRLQVPLDPGQWSDEDALFAMSQAGADLSGDLIVGDGACTQWLAERAGNVPGTEPVPESGVIAHYAAQAAQAVASGVPGSSAAGEFPKFTARRVLADAATPHVIVKFSGQEPSATVRRWSDLLVCEHLALQQVARLPGLRGARSRVLQGEGRTFLEVERFDRHGEAGRSPLAALDVIDAAFVGSLRADWPQVAARLGDLGLLDAAQQAAVQRLWWFGRLIANTDMHAGNLAFMPDGQGALRLAPVYDMLPMRHAPLPGGEVPTRAPEFSLPLPAQRVAWLEACTAALAFWREAASDARISEAFRAACRAHAQQLETLRERA